MKLGVYFLLVITVAESVIHSPAWTDAWQQTNLLSGILLICAGHIVDAIRENRDAR